LRVSGTRQALPHSLRFIEAKEPVPSYGLANALPDEIRLFVFRWRRTADKRWIEAQEDLLQLQAHGQLVIVERPGRKRLQLSAVYRSHRISAALLKKFGGRVERLPRNWSDRYARARSKPIKIGKRLVISRLGERQTSRHKRSHLIIPASLAFGTGEHATTAMSLRLLEQLTRAWKPGWSLVDLGTGTGILALAAKCFGGGEVLGIDNDPTAISMAKSNATLNKIRGLAFRVADVYNWHWNRRADVVTANLYSDLLVPILPKLHFADWLILSGVLRNEQHSILVALKKNGYEIRIVRRRGKWIAILARHRPSSGRA
jgi:ribosomal protein L11 methyltransferase